MIAIWDQVIKLPGITENTYWKKELKMINVANDSSLLSYQESQKIHIERRNRR